MQKELTELWRETLLCKQNDANELQYLFVPFSLCESSIIDYFVQRNCNLTQIGGLGKKTFNRFGIDIFLIAVDSKGYGIATPKGSRWKDRISQAILYLQEKSAIQVMVSIQYWN